MVCVRVSEITNPPPVPCSVLDPSVKQQMPWVLASMMSELSLFLSSACLYLKSNSLMILPFDHAYKIEIHVYGRPSVSLFVSFV